MPLGSEFWYSIFLHFRKQSVVVSHHAKFQLITKTGSRFFRTVLSRFYSRHYSPVFRKLACELAEVTLEAHLKPNTFICLLAARNITVVEGRFPANCLLYGLEMFVAAAVVKGITCVVQCYNNKSNHRAGISLHQSLASRPAMEK